MAGDRTIPLTSIDPCETEQALRRLLQFANTLVSDIDPVAQIHVTISQLSEALDFLAAGRKLNAQMLVLTAIQGLSSAASDLASSMQQSKEME